jgi:hypothetical protein
LIGRLADVLRRRGMRQGVIGGNRRWLGIWAVVVSAQLLHRVFKAKPTVVRYELKAGDTIVVTDLGGPDGQP